MKLTEIEIQKVKDLIKIDPYLNAKFYQHRNYYRDDNDIQLYRMLYHSYIKNYPKVLKRFKELGT